MLRHSEPLAIDQSNAGSDIDHCIPMAQRRTILSVNAATCRWPIGDPQSDGFYLCGAAKNAGNPYCERHAHIAVRSNAPIRKWI
jgi:GcrA cell cycle regulator